MNFTDIFFSPALRPFIGSNGKTPRKKLPIAVHIRYRESRLHEITECVYLANSLRELTVKIRELHRVQSSMGLPIAVSPEKAERSGTFLHYMPLDEPFRLLTDAVIIEATGKKIPLRKTRWIAHEKKKFEF